MNKLVEEQWGLFTYLNLMDARSYHDISIIHQQKLESIFRPQRWIFQILIKWHYLVGEEIFIMLQIEKYELMLRTNMDAIKAFNNMHVNIYFLRLSFKVMWLGLRFKFLG